MIPIKIYLYLLIILIIIFILILLYTAFVYKFINEISKKGVLWYLIIILLNLFNVYYVLDFYEKNKYRKGKKGMPGDVGPRGFKGTNQLCNSCGSAGLNTPIYGGNINDNGKKIYNNSVVPGKCIFPVESDHKYHYTCIKTKPPNSSSNDASIFGWCPTKVNRNFEPITYAYCNENRSIHEKLIKNKKYRQNRKNYIQNNSGILDIKVVAENTNSKAHKECKKLPGNYEFYERDLNKGTEGKFVHLCIKRGLGNTGITDIKILEQINNETSSPTTTTQNMSDYTKLDVDLNTDSGPGGQPNKSLYMYVKKGNKNFIQDIVVQNKSEGSCTSLGNGFEKKWNDLNDGTRTNPQLNTDFLHLCINKQYNNIISIDTAFVYRDGFLYIFRGNKYYKMKNVPIQDSIGIQNNYPKNNSTKWGKTKITKFIYNDKTIDKNIDKIDDTIKCSDIIDSKKCTGYINCLYDTESKKCETNYNYDAVFTYGYDKKTYFFKGNMVYKYNDKKMEILPNYPKQINDIFKGVPDNINAVFTWGKDGITYFFKGPFYYKYNDKEKRVERGYPKRSNRRWENMPNVIDAIFTIPFSLDNNNDNHATYVISGEESWYIDPISDKLKNMKNIDNRFTGLEVTGNIISLPTTISS
jgi:hypothetical protein